MNQEDFLDDLEGVRQQLLVVARGNAVAVLERALAHKLLEPTQDELAIPEGLVLALPLILFEASLAPVDHCRRGPYHPLHAREALWPVCGSDELAKVAAQLLVVRVENLCVLHDQIGEAAALLGFHIEGCDDSRPSRIDGSLVSTVVAEVLNQIIHRSSHQVLVRDLVAMLEDERKNSTGTFFRFTL